MSKLLQQKDAKRPARALLCLGFALVWMNCVQANAAEQAAEAPKSEAAKPDAAKSGVPRQHAPRHARGQTLDDRVKLLAKELDLDAKQQAEVRKLLEGQRDQVKRVWDDTAAPAANRIAATQAIGDKTGDAIRALLNEEQKKKYNSAKPPRDAETSPRPNVEDWMNGGKGRK
jgi:hypothetical protein